MVKKVTLGSTAVGSTKGSVMTFVTVSRLLVTTLFPPWNRVVKYVKVVYRVLGTNSVTAASISSSLSVVAEVTTSVTSSFSAGVSWVTI